MSIRTFLSILGLVTWFIAEARANESPIDFGRDILPILSENCFQCHGPDAEARQANLRLDLPDGLQIDRGGYVAVVVGKPDESELVRRIESMDEDARMPPSDSNLSLTAKQKTLLRQWIAAGAPWQKHWSFLPVDDSPPPIVSNAHGSRNEIDPFVLRRLRIHELEPSPEASRATLLRRLSLDLTGLPPTWEQIRAFVDDDRPGAYQRVVDRLLMSPRYGEHMSLAWLDAARYADTDGYQNDGPRSMWRWRDWVIDSLNKNVPFDQFTIEQLAGDWIPNATIDQRIATGFNRNHRYNSEAGLVLEEFLLENAVDRVDTVSTVWLGVTMRCARCHDHKFDAFTQQEYYQLIALFNDVSESGRAVKYGNSEPWITAPTSEQQQRLVELDRKVDASADALLAADKQIARAQSEWEQSRPILNDAPPLIQRGLTHRYASEELTLDGKSVVEHGTGPMVLCQKRSSVSFWIKPQSENGVILSVQSAGTQRPGLAVELRYGQLQFYIITRWISGVAAVETSAKLGSDRWVHVVLTNDGSQRARGMKVFLDGREVETSVLFNTNSNAGGTNKNSVVRVGGGVHGGKFKGAVRDIRFYDRSLFGHEIAELASLASLGDLAPFATRTEQQNDAIRAWFLEHAAPESLRQLADSYHQSLVRRQAYWDSLPTVMVMDHQSRGPTHVRTRGVYDAYGDQVSPGVPDVFPALQNRDDANRLDFARWLVSDNHPLTSRVAVNRAWQHFFGQGLVNTPEDFGVQGSPPSHPQLLDWLATYFVRSGWDVKQLHRLIVTSATYRQSSHVDASRLSKDPVNRWLSRAPRKRLPAHVIRDQALFVSDLLDTRIGGPSVSPYQPEGLWRELSNMRYQRSRGADLYRRSLYTIWKRTLVPPTMSILDAADRENCSVQPKLTNTPLQALTLLNETAFVESARGLAIRMMKHDDSLRYGFAVVTGREPTEDEESVLRAALDEYRTAYRNQTETAEALLSVGESRAFSELEPVDLAAHAVLANMLLNLDETITRE